MEKRSKETDLFSELHEDLPDYTIADVIGSLSVAWQIRPRSAKPEYLNGTVLLATTFLFSLFVASSSPPAPTFLRFIFEVYEMSSSHLLLSYVYQ